MNDDDFKHLTGIHGLRLLGVVGGQTPQPSVGAQPVATLIQWQALRTPAGAIHLVGCCTERREGRASTAVISFDPAARQCTTASGRTYVLSGLPGRNSDASWVWEQFPTTNGITDVVNVTSEVEAELARKAKP